MTDTMYPSSGIDLTDNSSAPGAAAPSFDLTQLKSSATDRLTTERDKFTQSLRSFSDELREMQTSSPSQGPATSLMGQVADRGDQVLSYVESRDPQQLFSDARGYARSHPVAFLAGAVVVGGVLGRLTRTAAAASQETELATTGSASSENGAYTPPSGGNPGIAGVYAV